MEGKGERNTDEREEEGEGREGKGVLLNPFGSRGRRVKLTGEEDGTLRNNPEVKRGRLGTRDAGGSAFFNSSPPSFLEASRTHPRRRNTGTNSSSGGSKGSCSTRISSGVSSGGSGDGSKR